MTQEHALRAYKNFKEQLENPKIKQVWKNNIQHAIDSILIRHPEFADISEEKEEELSPPISPATSKKKKEK